MPHQVAGARRTRGGPHVPNVVYNPKPTSQQDGTALPIGDGIDDAVPDLAALVAALNLDDQPEEGDGGDKLEGGATRSQFDWAAYHAVWQQTLIDEAITAMFAELAVLHAEMTGYTRSTSPMTLTLDLGKTIADRAERFVTLYVTPILGHQRSTKVH